MSSLAVDNPGPEEGAPVSTGSQARTNADTDTDPNSLQPRMESHRPSVYSASKRSLVPAEGRKKPPPPPKPADLISHRAEHFRSRLIDHFRLLDTGIDDDGRIESAGVTSRQLVEAEDAEFQTHMANTPYTLVSFTLATALDAEMQEQAKSKDRRMMRLEYRIGRSIIPMIQITTGNILRSKAFDGLILALVMLNSLTLGVQAEMRTIKKDGSVIDTNEEVNRYLDYFDRFCLVMFVIEILLKWIDNFLEFWLNGWNIFDFVVTMVTVVPEVMRLFATETPGAQQEGKSIKTYFRVMHNIRIFRIFRSLKTVTRIEKVRLLVSAIINAFTAMVFITILLGVFLYIFAIFGVIVFRGPTDTLESDATDPDVKWNRFGDMWAAMATLFQIFTLDNWLNIARQTEKNGGALTYVYIILWILIGSFIFNNIFVGIMVNNFQNIRNELFREVKELEQTHRIAKETIEAMESTHDSAFLAAAAPSNKSVIDASMNERQWEREVINTLELLQRHSQETVWPKDTLFQFLLMLEALLENLEERTQLMMLSKDALLTLHDD